MRRGLLGFVIVLLAGTFGVFGGGVASAATIQVNCPTDNLQTKITNAPSGSTLQLHGTCTGNFTIPSPKTLTLTGPATLDGDNTGTVLTVQSGATATLNSTAVQHGHPASTNGGGILNHGTLTLYQATIADNKTGHSGAGIANEGGHLTIQNSRLTRNVAANGSGGALTSFGGTATAQINASVIRSNQARFGGGLENEAELIVNGSSINSNAATVNGGGLLNFLGTLTLKSSSVTQNAAGNDGGGIWNNATFTQTGSSIINNTPDNIS